MKKHKLKQVCTEKIELRRGNNIVRSFFGTFGNGLKETRLTAGLAYIVSISPDEFLPFFGIKGTASNISVESYHEKNRSDILINTDAGVGVIEAKIDASDPHQQAIKYTAKWRVLLTSYMPANFEKKKNTKYISWKQLGSKLHSIEKKTKDKFQKRLISELLKYLEEHGMAKKENTLEVYAREINEKLTLELFLKGRFYGCHFQKKSRVGEALYFTPHFGKELSKNYSGVSAGISYVARIENVATIEMYDDLVRAVKAERGTVWWKNNKHLFDRLKSEWTWKKGNKRHVLWLGTPRLVFNPPVKKGNLQVGSGWLSKRSFTFDELFAGWRA